MNMPLSASRPSRDGVEIRLHGTRMPLDAFEIYIDDDRYAVPTLHLVMAEDATMAIVIARRMVADSAHHLGAEISRSGHRVAGIGTFETRRLPPGGPVRAVDPMDYGE